MSNTSTLTAEVLRQLADVAEGKKTLNEVIQSVTSIDEEKKKIKDSFDSFKNVISTLKRNIKESVKDEIRTNDLKAKYETSSAMEVKDSEGNTIGHIGLKTKQKKSWWEKVKENMATSFQNKADLLTGKKTLKQVLHEDASRLKENMMENSVVFRKTASISDGINKGLNRTIAELRGTAKPKPSIIEATNQRVSERINATSSNKYTSLDDGQFAVALGAAYDNFARLEHLNTPDNVKQEVLSEIGLVLEEAKKRFPNAIPEEKKGSYFKDQDVANAEQQLMPYMREAAKANGTLKEDVKRYETWRNGEDATIMTGALTVKEMPFENFARYANPDKSVSFTAEINHFRNPYESGSKTMSKKQMDIARQQLSNLHIK